MYNSSVSYFVLLYTHGTTVGKHLVPTFGLVTVGGGSRLMALSRNSGWKELLEVLVPIRAEDALSILQLNLLYLQGLRFHNLSVPYLSV